MRSLSRNPNRLNEFPPYMGGDTLVYGKYIWEFAPRHRLANAWGWVAQHRLVGEAKAGRPLVLSRDPQEQECVHHIDHNPVNNHPDNLAVLTMSAHRAHHTRAMMLSRTADITGAQVSAALSSGRSLKKAAALLHVHPQTLRNRFPEICLPYQRRSPEFLPQAAIETILQCAAKGMTAREAATIAKVSEMSAYRVAKRRGAKWVRRSRKGVPLGKRPTRSW